MAYLIAVGRPKIVYILFCYYIIILFILSIITLQPNLVDKHCNLPKLKYKYCQKCKMFVISLIFLFVDTARHRMIKIKIMQIENKYRT